MVDGYETIRAKKIIIAKTVTIVHRSSQLRTNIPGVFSAGDVNAKRYRQIATAVADGTIAAIGVTKELE